jgi:putative phosphoribosyl transferase
MAYPEEEVRISGAEVQLEGGLRLPQGAQSLIIFAHGSGSSRFSPRNKYVANYLSDFGFATLLVDLLSTKEDRLAQNRFNIELLSMRLLEVVEWARNEHRLDGLYIGLFGASTGAASAIICASRKPQLIHGRRFARRTTGSGEADASRRKSADAADNRGRGRSSDCA